MARLLTQSQFARRSGYSRARISQLVKQGVIILKNQKVDPAQAEPAIEANIDRSRRLKSEAKSRSGKTLQMELLPNGFNNDSKNAMPQGPFNTQSGNGKGYEGKSLTETRRDLTLLKISTEDLKRQLKEIDLRIKLGELIERSEVLGLFTYRIQIVRQGLLSFHRSLPPLLVEKDAREISDILKERVFDLLDRFSQRTGILKRKSHGRKKRILARRTETVAPAPSSIGQ